MLAHPTLDQLRELNLDGMIKAINDLEASDQVAELSHLEWLGLINERRSACHPVFLHFAANCHRLDLLDGLHSAQRLLVAVENGIGRLEVLGV